MAGRGLGRGLTLPGGSSVEDRRNILGSSWGRGLHGENWEVSIERVEGWLEKWRWLLPEMFFRGWTLIVNNLVSSTLWHKMMCAEPLVPLLNQIRQVSVGFISDKLHWIPQSVLFHPKDERGSGVGPLS